MSGAALAGGTGAATRRARPVRAGWQAWRRLPASLRSGLVLLVAAVLLAAAGLFMVDPQKQELTEAYLAPGAAGHLLGTDGLGHDVLSWVSGGVRTSLLVGAAVVAVSSIFGTMVGIVAGYAGGIADALLMRLVDLQLAIPPILLFITASATVGGGIVAFIALVSIVGWVPYARVVRTQILVERQRASISAARLAGARRTRVILLHLLPASATLILVLASLQFGFVLLAEAGLSFVGLGVQPPDSSLGYLIAQGREDLAGNWWVVLAPGTVLVSLLLASNLIGDGLQELFDVDVDVVDK